MWRWLILVTVLPRYHTIAPEFINQDSDDGGRIIGGQQTEIEDHPHQISLLYKGRHICGGSIIDKEWIVTAAHCLRRSAKHYAVKTGSSSLRDGGRTYKIRRLYVHEDYVSDSPDFDIGLIRLDEDLEFDEKTSAVSLASSEDRYKAGTTAVVTGWGVWNDDGQVSDYLREVQVPLVASAECLKLFDNRLITRRMICAGYVYEGGKDACSGDSGGPLVQDGILIGIVSWGFGCASPTHPGVYARVSSFRTWIHEKSGV